MSRPLWVMGALWLSTAACGWGPSTDADSVEATAEADPVDDETVSPSLPEGPPGAFVLTPMKGEVRDLTLVLLDHAEQARPGRRRPYLLLTTPDCPHCKDLLAALDDPQMVQALSGADVLHLQVQAGSPWLDDPALAARRPHRVPALFAVDGGGQLGDRLTGDAWGAGNRVDEMAPVIAEFVRTHGVDLPRPDPSDLPEDLQPVEIAPGVVLKKLPQGLPKDVELVPVQGGPPMYRKED